MGTSQTIVMMLAATRRRITDPLVVLERFILKLSGSFSNPHYLRHIRALIAALTNLPIVERYHSGREIFEQVVCRMSPSRRSEYVGNQAASDVLHAQLPRYCG